ncbi:hypothetical protein JB92DRAFT_921918 [Gautieria morchelliformis]|nr:hypothetical protein JB92DRAFT_921918 [Gautieria morchelliformis]
MLRNEFNQVAHRLEMRRKMQKTVQYTHTSGNAQSRLDGLTKDYEEKGKEVKTKMDGILSKLVDADVFATGAIDEEALAHDRASLRQVRTRLDQLEGAIHNLTLEATRWSSQSKEQHDEPGQKRPHDSVSDAARAENDQILKRLEHLETLLADIDNRATQQAEMAKDILDARVEQKMSNLHLGEPFGEEGEVIQSATGDPEPGMSQDQNLLQEEVTRLARDHDEFEEETANQITKHAEISADVRRLQEENKALKQALAECQASLRVVQDSSDSREREFQAIAAAVKADSEGGDPHRHCGLTRVPRTV